MKSFQANALKQTSSLGSSNYLCMGQVWSSNVNCQGIACTTDDLLQVPVNGPPLGKFSSDRNAL